MSYKIKYSLTVTRYSFFHKIFVLTIVSLLLNSILLATNVPIKVNLRQPNGYTFTAYGEGDEFLQRFKTLDNYTIVCSTGDWWYYAYQGNDGKLYPTKYRVGIEDTDASSTLTQDINYSTSIIDQAKIERISFSENITIASVSPKSLGVILIDFPNPFNPSTTIEYQLSESENVKLTVYSLLGDEIAVLVDEYQQSGYHSVQFDAKNLSSGIYIYSLEINNKKLLRKMVLVK